MYVVTAQQMQHIDAAMEQQYGVPPLLLMEHVGRQAAEFMLRHYRGQAFVLLIGGGNNGADGLACARYLQHAGQRTVIVLARPWPELSKGASPAALVQHKIAQHAGWDVITYEADQKEKLLTILRSGSVVIDCLLGTGAQLPLREGVKEIMDWLRPMGHTTVALDLPSGLMPDTGKVDVNPIKAEHTLALGAAKPCHYTTPASLHCGQVHVLDIHLRPELLAGAENTYRLASPAQIKQWHQPRQASAHKGDFGHVLLAGGSRGKAGAIALSTLAALEVGAGLATAFIPGSAACSFHRSNLEGMSIPYGVESTPRLDGTAGDVLTSFLTDKKAMVVGPGLSVSVETRDFLEAVLRRCTLPLVMDADALNLLADYPELWQHMPPDSIITPHPGEMGRLMGLDAKVVQAQRLEHALELARQRGVIVVLKGAGTLTTTPVGHVYFTQAGNPGMASAGVGDVLTGAIGGLLAQGYEPHQAAATAVYLHARAGDLAAQAYGQEGVTAEKVSRYLGMALQEVYRTPGAERRQTAESLEPAPDPIRRLR